MKNNILFILKSKLVLNIKGNNIERFIKRLKNNNIELLNIYYISNNEINIKIYKYDYEKIISIKTIYVITVLEYYGFQKIKNSILSNKYIIVLILISLIFLYIISNLIFSIDVITNDSKMENILIEELNDYGIKKYKFKKNYEELNKIKKDILSKHKNELEWIEIENIGTKYIIRYEPRILNETITDKTFRNIISKKDAIISDINVSSGEILKNVNSYVKKGETIVSGYIYLNDSIKDTVRSNGTIYGEVWYNVQITYPYKIHEEHLLGNKNTVLVIKFLNKEIELFNFNKYKYKDKIDKTVFKNNILPIKIVMQTQKEKQIIDETYNENELIDVMTEYSKNKILEKLNNDEYIKDYKILNKINNNDTLTLNIFFSVIENITEYQEIEEYIKQDNEITS